MENRCEHAQAAYLIGDSAELAAIVAELHAELSRSVATGAGPAGRGLLVIGGAWEPIQVARPG